MDVNTFGDGEEGLITLVLSGNPDTKDSADLSIRAMRSALVQCAEKIGVQER